MTTDFDLQNGEIMLVLKITSKFEESLISVLSDCSNVNAELKKYRELLQNTCQFIPQDFGSVIKKSLNWKISNSLLSLGKKRIVKEEDYLFPFQVWVLDILKNSRNDPSSQCHALKAECCPKIVKNWTSLNGIFQCLDERLGNPDCYALRIITSILRFPAVVKVSTSIVAFFRFYWKISDDITGANVLI